MITAALYSLSAWSGATGESCLHVLNAALYIAKIEIGKVVLF